MKRNVARFTDRRRSKIRFTMAVVFVLVLLVGTLSLLGVATSKIISFLDEHPETTAVTNAPAVCDPQESEEFPDRVFTEHALTVERGNTLLSILQDRGIAACEAFTAIAVLRKVYDPRDLRPGQKIIVTFSHVLGDPTHLQFESVRIRTDNSHDILVRRGGGNDFTVEELQRKLTTKPFFASAVIHSSLYESAVGAGLPLQVLMQLIRHFSFDVDFQRDVQSGDSFEVLYERQTDEEGIVVLEGPVLYASLSLRGTVLRIYRHTTSDGTADYYNEKGQTARKTLLKTPIDGARLTSSYGMRRHPILGYSSMHRGLDFAAPRGTPIMAAGSGTVVSAGCNGNYGRYIRLRHANGYATAYAHLSSFRRGVRSGKRVKQGEIIGYVGTSGLATGPHLHYEVHYCGRNINPARVKFPPRRSLAATELERFNKTKTALDHQYALVRSTDPVLASHGVEETQKGLSNREIALRNR